jgi:G3E family GTPase
VTRPKPRIPATVLTGFLGAGKTTLLRRILTEKHGRRIAVIENEFAEENIDGEILAASGAEQIVQMTNGCVCCSIRADLRSTLADLAKRRTAGEIAFDQVIVETTGLADPGPIAQTFFLDPPTAARYRPDAILTLVDAKHADDQLDARKEARRQVGFADRLFISKSDLVGEDELVALRARLRQINASAPQRVAHFGDVDLAEVFDLGGFNLRADLDPTPTDEHDHDHGHPHHHHDDDVSSFVFRSERPLDPTRFGQFVNAAITSQGAQLLRYKGVLAMHGRDHKVILQGVHQLMSYDAGAPWAEGEARVSKLVFIGVKLPKAMFASALARCVV